MGNTTGKKFGGRTPGTPNKKNQELIDKAKELDVDVAVILLLTAKGDVRDLGYEDRVSIARKRHEKERLEHDKYLTGLTKEQRLRAEPFPEFIEPDEKEAKAMNLLSIDERKDAAKDLMPYLYGKRKQIDSNGDDQSDPLSDLADAIRNRS